MFFFLQEEWNISDERQLHSLCAITKRVRLRAIIVRRRTSCYRTFHLRAIIVIKPAGDDVVSMSSVLQESVWW